jgi:hypothetical protein
MISGDYNDLREIFGLPIHSDNLAYVVLTAEIETESLAVVVEAFCDEPAGAHLVSDRSLRFSQWIEFCGCFSKECSSNGESIVCMDRETNQVAGVFWARDLMKVPPQDFRVDHLDCIFPTLKIIMALENDYHLIRPNLQIGDCCDLWMLAVSPTFRGRNIANTLTNIACQWNLRNRNYKYVILESSGGFSAKCAKSCGMKEIVSKDFTKEDVLFNGIEEQHSIIRLWELAA